MKTKYFICIAVSLFVNSGLAFCFEALPTSDLLLSYLENDNDLKNNAINAEKAKLSLQSTEINNGFDVTLSTGTVTIRTDKNGTSLSVKPSVQATLPQASNLKVNASASYTYANDTSNIEDTKLNASVDIISGTGLTRKISLLKEERNLEEATRKLRNQAIITEKAFYTELKSLLSSTNSLINLQKTLYTNKIDFEKIKAQGYSSGSSTYRLAQMRVVSGEHDIENSIRSLLHSYAMFYKKCGFDITLDPDTNFYDLVPKDITEIEPIDIRSFDPDTYSEVESALWTNKINTLQRQANKNFTLSANGGVTFNNSTTKSNTVDAGLSSTIGGVSLSAGVSVPLANEVTPAITLSASVTPNTFRQQSITNQINDLNEKQELIAIDTARKNYESKMVDYEENLINLIWNKNSDNESYEMYAELEKDLAKWYEQGIITESEYISAQINAQSYSVKLIIDTIELIIYNDNIVTMFTDI